MTQWAGAVAKIAVSGCPARDICQTLIAITLFHAHRDGSVRQMCAHLSAGATVGNVRVDHIAEVLNR